MDPQIPHSVARCHDEENEKELVTILPKEKLSAAEDESE